LAKRFNRDKSRVENSELTIKVSGTLTLEIGRQTMEGIKWEETQKTSTTFTDATPLGK